MGKAVKGLFDANGLKAVLPKKKKKAGCPISACDMFSSGDRRQAYSFY